MNQMTVIGGLLIILLLAFLRYLVGPGKLHHLVTDDRDHDKLSPGKIGSIAAITTFTFKMLGLLPSSPDEPFLWLCFMATVGGYEVAKKALTLKLGGQPPAPARE